MSALLTVSHSAVSNNHIGIHFALNTGLNSLFDSAEQLEQLFTFG